MNCIDRLGEALCHLARRSMPSPLRYDSGNRLRMITSRLDFPGVADAAFHMIRQYGCGSAAVLIRMLETMALIAGQARRREDLAALAYHAQLVASVAQRTIPEESDLSDIDRRYQAVEKVLSERGWTARS
jgi:uncharacterized membrane protein